MIRCKNKKNENDLPKNNEKMTNDTIQPEKWMSYLSDDLSLSEINIPGTHNSCASKISLFARCQSLSIMDQLNSGVRYLDVRCRHLNDEFCLHHGSFKIDLDFDEEVLGVCIKFLNSHPTETIVMLVSSEHVPKNNKCQFDDIFFSYISKFKNYWYLNETVPLLKNARGKIVLLRRFASCKRPFGIDMSGWCGADIKNLIHIQNHPDFKFIIQDDYNSSAGNKWSSMSDLFVYIQKQAKRENSDKANSNVWYINYGSSQNWPAQPPVYIAYKIKNNLLAFLKDLQMNQGINYCLGTIIVDYAEEPVIEQIFLLNFVNKNTNSE